MSGARKKELCKAFNIPIRTIQRWEKTSCDKRKGSCKNPANKLSIEERNAIIDVCCQKRFVDLSPHEIVPILAEEGSYLASESTFYRILRNHKMMHHRTNCKEPRQRAKVETQKSYRSKSSMDMGYYIS